MANNYTVLPIIYCQAKDFFDKLEELYVGQVIVVSRFSDKTKEPITDVFMKTGVDSYKKINDKNGDVCNVDIRKE